jgi:deoxyadenosine/deoxycytidine kinase
MLMLLLGAGAATALHLVMTHLWRHRHPTVMKKKKRGTTTPAARKTIGTTIPVSLTDPTALGLHLRHLLPEEETSQSLSREQYLLGEPGPTGKHLYISIEGNIASGKTTALNLLPKREGYFFVSEPVEKFAEFEDFNPLLLSYENPHDCSPITQLHILECLFKSDSETTMMFKMVGDAVVISERTLASSACFIRAQIANKVFHPFVGAFLLHKLKEFLSQTPYKPTFTIFLEASPDICWKNIKSRDRSGEEYVSHHFLKVLGDEMCKEYKGRRNNFTIEVRENMTKEEVARQVHEIIANIVSEENL